MKKYFLPIVSLLLTVSVINCQILPAAPKNKAVVYFVRTSSLGFAINFTYFDSAKVIAKTNGTNYVRYECDTGYHLFWARSENRDFVEAELDSGKIYFLEAIPQMGGFKAGVKLQPVDPANEKTMNRFFKLMNKKAPENYTDLEREADTINFKDVIERGLTKYKEEKEKGKEPSLLKRTAYYKN